MKQHRKHAFLMALILISLFGFTASHAQPSLVPPVALGPDSLAGFGGSTGFHEFFTQPVPNDWKGDIRDISAGDTFWVYVVGIDVTGLTGPAGRQIKFNLQDAETGSFFKHLGISFSLNNPVAGGAHLLECYQSNGEGLSTHGLDPDSLTIDDFDLRFSFHKPDTTQNWTIKPYFRLSGQIWTAFSDGSFTASLPFDFFGAKLVVQFDNPINGAPAADGAVSFDNFFVIGLPLQGPFTDYYVDNDWENLDNGDAVQFPGQDNIQVLGTNAFARIQDVFDPFIPSTAFSGRLQAQESVISSISVFVAPGSYSENLYIPVRTKMYGSGSGTDDTENTIIISDQGSMPVINVNGALASGSSEDRTIIKDVRVTGATGSDFAAAGILVFDPNGQTALKRNSIDHFASSASGLTTTEYLTFENVTSVNNQGSGIAFDHTGMVNNIDVLNCNLSNNSEYGLHISSSVSSFDGLTVDSCTVNDNGINGLTTGPSGSGGVTDVSIRNSSFSGNGDGSTLDSGDISFYIFNGDALLENVDITGDGAHMGLRITGISEPCIPIGTVELSDVTVTGSYQHPEVGYGSGIFLSEYLELDSLSFLDVQIDVSEVTSLDSVANLQTENLVGTMDFSNTTLGGNATMDIYNRAPSDIDATSSVFTGAADNFAIENRVIHAVDLMDAGIVTWVPQNFYLTPQSFVWPDTSASIVRVISVSATGDTINFSQGTFYGFPSVNIDKDLTFQGVDKATTIVRAGGMAYGDGWFHVEAGNVLHVHDMTFDGNNLDIYDAFYHEGRGSFNDVCFNDIQVIGEVMGPAPAYAGTGVYAAGDGPINVLNCTFTNMGHRGVYYSNTGVNGSLFRGNTYTGKGQGSFLDFAVQVSNGAIVTIRNNTISKNQGIVNEVLGMAAGRGSSPPNEESAGILVTSTGESGTNVNVDSTEVFDCHYGVLVGLDTLDQSFVVIKRSNFHDNEYGAFTNSALFLKAENTSFDYNLYGLMVQHATVFDLDAVRVRYNQEGINVWRSFGEIDDSLISENDDNGVTIADEFSTGISVNQNDFCTNGIYGVQNLGSSMLNAMDNWWGAFDGPGGAGNGEGDSVSTAVDFSLFETNSIFPDSPCAPESLCVADGDVNDSGVLTPGDALAAFEIALNGQALPAEHDVADFVCEVSAADANCSGSVTPGDALAIFEESLSGGQPGECFAAEASLENLQPALKKTYELALKQQVVQSLKKGSKGQVEFDLLIENPAGLRSFGMTLNFPEGLTFVGLERSRLTANWNQLDAVSGAPGSVAVGGFSIKPIESEQRNVLVKLIFEYQDGLSEPAAIDFGTMLDDFDGAVVESGKFELTEALPERFALHQNYPNPFNPETQIQFEIPKSAQDKVNVSIDIYNVTGQLVRSLVSEKKGAGVYRVTWDGKNDRGHQMPSAAYFYSIKAGSFKETKKMLLVK